MGLMKDCHPDHEWYQLFCDPGVAGFNATARRRTWCIGAHRDLNCCLRDPFILLEEIDQRISNLVQLRVEEYLVASAEEIWTEGAVLAAKRGVTSFSKTNCQFTQILTTRELNTVKALDEKYRQKYGMDPESDRSLTYFLGDGPAFCCWSGNSGQIPTYRRNARSGLFWLPAHSRWLTNKEKLLSMGFPVRPEQRQALKCESLGTRDYERASDMIGNCFHFQVSGIMQLVALSCFGPREQDQFEQN